MFNVSISDYHLTTLLAKYPPRPAFIIGTQVSFNLNVSDANGLILKSYVILASTIYYLFFLEILMSDHIQECMTVNRRGERVLRAGFGENWVL